MAMTKPASNLLPLMWAFPHALTGKNAAVMLCLELHRLLSHCRLGCERLTIWVLGRTVEDWILRLRDGSGVKSTYHSSRGLGLVHSTHTGHLSQSQ